MKTDTERIKKKKNNDELRKMGIIKTKIGKGKKKEKCLRQIKKKESQTKKQIWKKTDTERKKSIKN